MADQPRGGHGRTAAPYPSDPHSPDRESFFSGEGNLDLFGVPIDPHFGCKGRPRHKPTDETRRIINDLQASGATLPVIASAVGLSIPTLYRHYLTPRRRSAK